MKLSERIYEIINAKHYKQASIAVAAGYDPKKFNAMLRGRKSIKPEDIMPICHALDVTPNELFGYN